MIVTTRNQRRLLAKENESWPIELKKILTEDWPEAVRYMTPPPFLVMRSRGFLLQAFAERDGIVRLSVCRSVMRGDGRWDDGIAWDELQRLKREAGYGGRYAVEVYPDDYDVVNVGNLRHLWLLPEPPEFAWRKPRPSFVDPLA